MSTRRCAADDGFTLLEIMLAVCVIGVVSAMATMQIGAIRPALQGDGAMRVVMGQLNAARETAITQRRSVLLEFVAPNTLRTTRLEYPAGTTQLTNLMFESGVRYGLVPGVADTPDGFGIAAATSFGDAPAVLFNTEGALVDTGGNPVDGTIFLTIPDQPMSFRAVTIQGATGRVRGWRWTGVWVRS